MVEIYDFYKYVDKKQNKIKIKTLDDSSRHKSEEDTKKQQLINEIETMANKLSLGIYDYVE